MSTSTEQDWVEALDRFEAGLDHHARTLELAADAVTSPGTASPWPPPRLPTGPIPDGQVDRARALATRCDALHDDVVAALAEAVNPPRRAGRRSPAHHGYRATPDHARISIDL